MKLCSATFPILFFEKNKTEIRNFFNPHTVMKGKNFSVDIFFEIENGENLKKKAEIFAKKYRNTPMFFSQEEDFGGYEFSKGQNIYILPGNLLITENYNEKPDKIALRTLKKVKTIEELQNLIEKAERKVYDMDAYYRAYNAGKYDERFFNALFKLAESLEGIYDLCFDVKVGYDFNNEILSDKLAQVWGKSIDEMLVDIRTVAKEMECDYEEYQKRILNKGE